MQLMKELKGQVKSLERRNSKFVMVFLPMENYFKIKMNLTRVRFVNKTRKIELDL